MLYWDHSSVLSDATRVLPREYSSVSSNVVRVSLRTLVSFIKCFKSLTERTFISFVQCCICVTQNIRQFHQMLHEESHVPRRRTLGQRTFNSCSQRYACLTENACQVHPVLHSVPKKSNSSNANTMFHTKRWSGSSNATRIPRRPWSASSRCCLLQSLGSLAKAHPVFLCGWLGLKHQITNHPVLRASHNRAVTSSVQRYTSQIGNSRQFYTCISRRTFVSFIVGCTCLAKNIDEFYQC